MRYGCKSYFEVEWLDNALLAGMTPDEFWFGDPELYYNYTRVYEQKVQYEQQCIWQMGARMCQALESTVIFPAGVVDKKVIHSMPKYPECPFTEKVNNEPTEEEIRLIRLRTQISMENWVNSFKHKKENNQGE